MSPTGAFACYDGGLLGGNGNGGGFIYSAAVATFEASRCSAIYQYGHNAVTPLNLWFNYIIRAK